VSEGYEGTIEAGPGFRRRFACGTETACDHVGIPFRGHVFRVSGFLRDELRTQGAAPDGRIRRT